MSRRDRLIDFLRGVVILDMMLVHFSDYLGSLPYMMVQKLIGYSDIAIEGFVTLSGVMIGRHYYGKFIRDRKAVIRRLLRRTADVVGIYYLMVVTISLPTALIMGRAATGGDNIAEFMGESLLFLNQVGLIHILPTFIPLFLLAIPTLFLLERNGDFLVLIASVGFFVLGSLDPYVFTIGEKTIFPVVLWQMYFFFGMVLGKRSLFKGDKSVGILPHLALASALFLIGAAAYHGHHLSPGWELTRDEYGLVVRKFPLNYLGVIYHGGLLYLLVCLIALLWGPIQRMGRAAEAIELFGRHSLLSFVIHVYFAKTIGLLIFLTGKPTPLSQILIIGNVLVTVVILKHIESLKRGSVSSSVSSTTLERGVLGDHLGS